MSNRIPNNARHDLERSIANGAGTAKDAVGHRVTAADAMSAAQAAYLKTLCDVAGEPFERHLSKFEATKRIAFLQQKTGRSPKHILTSEQTDG